MSDVESEVIEEEDSRDFLSSIQDFQGMGMEAEDQKKILYAKSLAPDDLLNTELTKEECIIYAMFDAMNDNGDEEVSLMSPTLGAFTRGAKLNLISKDRQGRKEVVSASRGEDEDKGRLGSVVDFITGRGEN